MTDWNISEFQEAPVPEVWSGDGKVRTNEQMLEWAEQNDCTFEEADERTLFIDVDSEEQMRIFNENWHLADSLFNLGPRKKIVTITPSKSGLPKRHIRVKMRETMPLLERIALQACLGSDLKREMISVKRARDGEQNVVVFFEKKEAVK